MKITDLIPWLLAGGLAASTLWNLHLVQRLEDLERRLAPVGAESAPPIPVRVVDQLGLTEQQCELIRDCSLN